MALNWIDKLLTRVLKIGGVEQPAKAKWNYIGATVVEKHITYDRAAAGPDHAASADPQQFARYVKLIREADLLRGGASRKCVLDAERDVRAVSRQSLVVRRDIRAGEAILEEDLTVQRPGTGISAAMHGEVVGRRALRPLPAWTLLQWDMLEESDLPGGWAMGHAA